VANDADSQRRTSFPLYRFFGGVAFMDAGNVWEKTSDSRLTDLRAGAGSGSAVETHRLFCVSTTYSSLTGAPANP
jgi:hypothetical protein